MARAQAPRPYCISRGLINVARIRAGAGYLPSHNVTGTKTLLQAMQEEGVRRLVFSSSCAVYGAPDAIPIPEDAPCRPLSPYGHKQIESGGGDPRC